MSVAARPAAGFTHAHWRDAIQSSAAELARVALGFTSPTTIALAALADTERLVGAHIPLVGRPSYELWFVASRASCAALADAVLGGMDVEALPIGVTNDAICELVNMLAGGVKRRLVGSDLELGLPVFVNGSVEPSDRLSAATFRLQLGAVETHVVVLGPR
jgi:CheY-specific phosphatase CheX